MKSAFEQFVETRLAEPSQWLPTSGFKRVSLRNMLARQLLLGQSMDLPPETIKQVPGNMSRATGFRFRQERQPDGWLRIWRIG